MVELIAHRAGNDPDTAHRALGVADLLELDVHLFRGDLEVRHAKVLWPTRRLWEPWTLLPRDAPRPSLESIVDAVPPDASLWIDLKWFTTRLSRRVIQTTDGRPPSTVSARSWWILRPWRRQRVRTMRSVGSRWQLSAVRFVRSWTELDGVVIDERLVTDDVIERLRRSTSMIVVWNVTDLRRGLELIDQGVSGLIIDDVALIAEIRHAVHGR